MRHIEGPNKQQYNHHDELSVSGGALASIFASVSPEEDFVETFKYYVLSSTTTHPDLTIAGITNAVSRVQPGAGVLGTKVNCILKLLPTQPIR